MSGFRRGKDQAEQAGQRAGGGGGGWTPYFKLGDEEEAFVRFLTGAKDWLTVTVHQYVPTKPAPAGHEGKWPGKLSAICRKDEAIADRYPQGCYICDHVVPTQAEGRPRKMVSPKERTAALLVVRQAVDADGKAYDDPAKVAKRDIAGFKDRTFEIEFEQDGKPVTVIRKDYQLALFPWGNFYEPLAIEFRDLDEGTELGYDFRIQRKGAEKDTAYYPRHMNDAPADLDDGRVLDFGLHPELLLERHPDAPALEELLDRMAGDEYWNRFWILGEGDSATPAKSSGDIPDERAEELRSRVAARVRGGETASEAPAEKADEKPKTKAAGKAAKDFG